MGWAGFGEILTPNLSIAFNEVEVRQKCRHFYNMRQIAAGLLQNVFQVCKNLACLAFDIARADQILAKVEQLLEEARQWRGWGRKGAHWRATFHYARGKVLDLRGGGGGCLFWTSGAAGEGAGGVIWGWVGV